MSLFSDAALVFLVSAAGCVAAGRVVIPALARAQSLTPVRYDDCPPLAAYQETKPRAPTMGGLFVLGVGGVAAMLWGGLADRAGWLVLGAGVGFGAIGLVDDALKFHRPGACGLRSGPKLLAALAIGALLGLGSGPHGRLVELPWLSRSIDLGWAWVPFAAMVIAGCAHAVNLTDGMDGLAAGCVAIALAVLGLWAVTDPPSRALVPWCAGLAGACVGFLWFNSFPASVVLGDVGALGLGAAVGAVSLLAHAGLWLVVIGGVFVAEAVSVMLQVASYKWRNKRRIFRVAPLHHHVHLGGMHEPKVIVRFWIVGLCLAMLGLTRLVVP